MGTPGLGVSVTGSLTHVASMAAALFVLSVAAGYTGQPGAAFLLFVFGIVTWVVYMSLALGAYRDDSKKKTRAWASAPKDASLTRMDVLESVLKAREKYTPEDLAKIYTWLNEKA